MTLSWQFYVFVGLCVVLSFLFSGMEAGVFTLSRSRLRQQMRAGQRRAALLHAYFENPENFLWTILIGNTLATFTAIGLIVVALYDSLSSRPELFVASFVGVVFLFYVFCDLLPKMLFRLFPTRLCLSLAVPFRFIHLALAPLVWVLTWFSDRLLRLSGGASFKGHLFGERSEMRLAMRESAQNLSSEERAMISRVLDLQDRTVHSVMTPLQNVVGVREGTSTPELAQLCREHPFTRLPVWQGDGSARRITGLVNLRSLLYSPQLDVTKPASAYLTSALYLREDLRLEEALRRMQRSGQRLAIVVGLDQKELGIVSLQDILRFIFGEVSL